MKRYIPGAGQKHSSGASGASHAGRGGKSAYITANNLPYCNIYSVCEWGSGGGSVDDNGGGGRGGGFLRIHSRFMQIDGTIKANGQPGQVSAMKPLSSALKYSLLNLYAENWIVLTV